MNTAPQQMELAGLLTEQEARDLVARIRGHLRNGRALLMELAERQGHRVLGYSTLEACAEAEFGWSKAHFYRHLSAAEVERTLGVSIGDLPESHLRELARLPVDLQPYVWERVGSEPGLTARRIREVAAEVRPPSPTLPNGGEPEPAPSPRPAQVITAFPSVVGLSCDWCGKRFEQKLKPGERAERVCPRCRVKGPTPMPEGDGGPDTSSPHGEGARRLEHTAAPPPPTPPREGDLAAPPETIGVISGAETVWVGEGTQKGGFVASPGADLAHGAADAVSRQAGGLGVDPDDSAAAEYVSAPASDDLDWLHARDITLAQALTLARRLIVACEAKGKTAEWGIGLLERPSVK